MRDYLEAYERDPLGARHLGDGRSRFLVWAPRAEFVEVVLGDRAVPTERDSDGYHRAEVEDVPPGTRYAYRLDGAQPLPDPASRHQPEGVHERSAVVDLSGFPWTDEGWTGIDLAEHVLYELHAGTFTEEGTFDAAIPRLDALAELGITAIELMPVAQFPGGRNWGYDGVLPFAVQDTYGGPEAYARLVDACHARGLAVVQDVVYNHLGPEGNVLPDFGPYLTDVYATPWGEAVNVDGPGSDHVRRCFVESALWLLRDLHVNALRLDAVHGIVDTTARPFLLELTETVDALAGETGRRIHLFAETDSNDPGVVAPREEGGLGIAAMWNDDFHHAIHALLTEERDGYYMDYGEPEQVATVLREGFWFTGRYSRYRDRRHGAPTDRVPADRLVVYAQNHDQIGNRPRGRRLGRLLEFEQRKLASGLVLLSPYLPLLFMGEEYGEPAPFHYFVSHSDPELIESVRRGRRVEFATFEWREEPPDPQDEGTFMASRLHWDLREDGRHAAQLGLHRELLRLRREHRALAHRSKDAQEVALDGRVLTLRRRSPSGDEAVALFNLADTPASSLVKSPATTLLDSADPRWMGPGSEVPPRLDAGAEVPLAPSSFVLLSGGTPA